MPKFIDAFLADFANFAWGMPLLVLLVGGGFFFMFYSRFLPFRFLKHAVDVLRGKFDDPNDPGDINHFQALSSALAATIGMGNISGVAIAIFTGGPGALFWMWVTAFVGMATKFFTCTLSIMYRGKDSHGDIQGGPMYMITEGLGQKWKPLAVLFAVAGLFGPLPIFQANQLTQILRDVVLKANGINFPNTFYTDLATGILLVIIVSTVIFGGIKRIGNVASKVVPFMVVLYTGTVLWVLAEHASEIPAMFLLIFQDAFTGNAVLGGALGQIIMIGVRRGAFSNEAGIGTEALAHGAAKTKEPVREGLVAMLGPAADTLIVCTMTGMAILTSGVWQSTEANGVTLTLRAFQTVLPTIGTSVLMICVLFFSLSSMFTYSYYGTKCFSFLFGARFAWTYNFFYIATLIFGAVASVSAVINLIDGMYAMMAIPTMTCTLLLAPKVRQAAIDYFSRMNSVKDYG